MRLHLPLAWTWIVVTTTATSGTVACTSQPHAPALHAQALGSAAAVPVARSVVEAQPLGANIVRLLDALDVLGAPVGVALRRDVTTAARERDAGRLQQLLDDRVLLVVHINPETRVRVARGPAAAVLQQAGYTPAIVKILNESRGTARLRIGSPQSGPVYAGMTRLAGERMQQAHLRENENVDGRGDRFLEVEMFSSSADDPEAERPGSRVCHRTDLLERGRPARGDDHVRRRTGNPGPRVPRRGAGVVHREAGGPGDG